MASTTRISTAPKSEAPQLLVEQAAMTPPSDFLSGFREINPDLPINFFTPTEEKLIQSMFQYDLTSNLCLIDLLGFNFYLTISKFNEACQSLNQAIPSNLCHAFIESFCKDFLSFYIRIMRNADPEKPATPAIILDQLLLTEQGFVKQVEELRQALGKITPQLPTLLSKASWASQPKLANEAVMVQYRVAIAELNRFRELKDLLEKIITSPFSQLLLSDFKVVFFPGSESLNTLYPDEELTLSRKVAIPTILAFLKFLDACFRVGTENRGLKIDDFRVLHDLISSNLSQTVSIPFIQQWNMRFHDLIVALRQDRLQIRAERSLACQGKLTFKQWEEKRKLASGITINQTVFIEILNIMCCILPTVELCVEDVNTMVELHFFRSFIPHTYRPKAFTVEMVIGTLQTFSEWTPTSERPWGYLPPGLQKCQIFLQKEVRNAYQPFFTLINTPEYRQTFSGLYSMFQATTLAYSPFFAFIKQLKVEALIDDIEKKLPTILREYIQSLTHFLAKAPSEQRSEWKILVEIECLIQIKTVFLIVSTINDIQTIREKSTFLADFDFLLRPALQAFLQLPGLVEDLFNTLPDPPSEDLIIQQPPLSAPTPQVKASPETPSPQRELLKQLKRVKKRREFEAILKELEFSFLRQGKGHQIWSNDQGSQIVLPFHNNSSTLKPSTQHSIVKQVAASLTK